MDKKELYLSEKEISFVKIVLKKNIISEKEIVNILKKRKKLPKDKWVPIDQILIKNKLLKISDYRNILKNLQNNSENLKKDENSTSKTQDNIQNLIGLENSSIFKNYKIIEELGRGGMGIVYKAEDIKTGKIVALKILITGKSANSHEIKRFEREIKICKQLTHPNIVSIYDSGEYKGFYYYSMKFIEGETLDKLIKKLSFNKLLKILIKSLEALDYMHKKNIIHRDIKPSNIIVDKNGIPYITDFGLSKKIDAQTVITQTGTALGTPFYMSPEQLRGDKNIDFRTDIYSFGILLYEIATKRKPFTANSLMGLYNKIVEEYPIPPSKFNKNVNNIFNKICFKAISKNPNERFSSAKEFADILKLYLNKKYSEIKINNKNYYLFIIIAINIILFLLIINTLLLFFHKNNKKSNFFKEFYKKYKKIIKKEKYSKALILIKTNIKNIPSFSKLKSKDKEKLLLFRLIYFFHKHKFLKIYKLLPNIIKQKYKEKEKILLKYTYLIRFFCVNNERLLSFWTLYELKKKYPEYYKIINYPLVFIYDRNYPIALYHIKNLKYLEKWEKERLLLFFYSDISIINRTYYRKKFEVYYNNFINNNQKSIAFINSYRGWIELILNQDRNKSKKYYENTLRYNKYMIEPRYQLARLYLEDNIKDKAFKYLKDIVKIYPEHIIPVEILLLNRFPKIKVKLNKHLSFYIKFSLYSLLRYSSRNNKLLLRNKTLKELEKYVPDWSLTYIYKSYTYNFSNDFLKNLKISIYLSPNRLDILNNCLKILYKIKRIEPYSLLKFLENIINYIEFSDIPLFQKKRALSSISNFIDSKFFNNLNSTKLKKFNIKLRKQGLKIIRKFYHLFYRRKKVKFYAFLLKYALYKYLNSKKISHRETLFLEKLSNRDINLLGYTGRLFLNLNKPKNALNILEKAYKKHHQENIINILSLAIANYKVFTIIYNKKIKIELLKKALFYLKCLYKKDKIYYKYNYVFLQYFINISSNLIKLDNSIKLNRLFFFCKSIKKFFYDNYLHYDSMFSKKLFPLIRICYKKRKISIKEYLKLYSIFPLNFYLYYDYVEYFIKNKQKRKAEIYINFCNLLSKYSANKTLNKELNILLKKYNNF